MLDLEDVEATKVALQQAHAVAQSAALGVRFGPREQVLVLLSAPPCFCGIADVLFSYSGASYTSSWHIFKSKQPLAACNRVFAI